MATLRQIVLNYDLDALAKHIAERYEVDVVDEHILEILIYLGTGFCSIHGDDYLDCRLRRILRDSGYFERLLVQPAKTELYQVWNVLHWPWANGYADSDASNRLERELLTMPEDK